MANTKSAEKRHRQSLLQNERNRAGRSRMRTAIKRLRAAIATKDASLAKELIPTTFKVIDETAQKNVIHDNAASRYKSRLALAVNALG